MRSFEVLQGLAGGLGQAGAGRKVALDQVDDHFGIRIRLEDSAFGLQLAAQLDKVFDNPVVHHHHIAGHPQVGMGVAGAWLAVGGPAGVSHAQAAVYGFFEYQRLQARQLAGIAADFDMPILQHCQPGRVIAAVFQAFQTAQNNRRRVTRPDITYYSTHKRFPPKQVVTYHVLRITLYVIRCENLPLSMLLPAQSLVLCCRGVLIWRERLRVMAHPEGFR